MMMKIPHPEIIPFFISPLQNVFVYGQVMGNHAIGCIFFFGTLVTVVSLPDTRVRNDLDGLQNLMV